MTAGRGATAPWRGVCSDSWPAPCVPDRQRTIRELETGRTLFKQLRKTPATGNGARAGERRLVDEGSGDRTQSARWIDLKTSVTAGSTSICG